MSLTGMSRISRRPEVEGCPPGRVRTYSETSSEGGDLVGKVSTGVGYDVDGKFSFTKVMTGAPVTIPKTTVDENGRFSYYSSDMRPVPPGNAGPHQNFIDILQFPASTEI